MKGKNDKKLIIVIVISAILVIAATAGVIFLLTDKPEEENTKKEKIQQKEVVYRQEDEESELEDEDAFEEMEDETEDEMEYEEVIQDEMVEDIMESASIESAKLLVGEPKEPLERYMKLPVIYAKASSTIQQDNTTNDPILMFDGLDETSWQEGVEGYGIGETVEFRFNDGYNMKYIGFKLGNWRDETNYYGNASPKTITLSIGNSSKQITFSGEWREEWVQLPEGVFGSHVYITIDDVYPGGSWDDTCIAEIEVYGEPLE